MTHGCNQKVNKADNHGKRKNLIKFSHPHHHMCVAALFLTGWCNIMNEVQTHEQTKKKGMETDKK